MEFLVVIPLGVVFGAAAVLFHRRQRQRWVRERCRIARSAGLQRVELEVPWWTAAEWISGWVGNVRVRISEYNRGEKETGTLVTLEGHSGISLRGEDGGTTIQKAMGAREVEIGDEAFDREVYVQGPVDIARAVLDVYTRARVRALIGGRVQYGVSLGAYLHGAVTVREGDVCAHFQEGQAEGLWANLSGVLKTLLAVSERLVLPESIVRRLVENTAVEPEWRVRRENILLLTRSYPNHPAIPQVLRHALEDERQEVQLEAALALGGNDGRRVLLEIATREWADDACAAKAIGALGEALPVERAREVLTHALRTRRIATAGACLEALGRVRGPEVVGLLAKVLAVETPPLARAAAAALGSSAAPAAEAPLLQALKRGGPEVRVAAAEALGHVGSAAAVLPLKEAAEEGGSLRRAARQAIAAIQSRLTGASPGQLSLTESDAGRLSLADADPKGQVSLVETDSDPGPGSRSALGGAAPGPGPERPGPGSPGPSR